jgi:hypothetical protein
MNDVAFRRLNHIELVYRPGERALAVRVFEMLGLRVRDRGGIWFHAFIDPAVADLSNNACYASEVTPEQWALEQALEEAIAAGRHGATNASALGAAATAYLDRLQAEPQRSFHFGIRYAERDDFDAALARIRDAERDSELAGRVTIAGIYHPDEPGALAPNMIQAFARTDVVAAGLLAFGQHVELQWHLPEREPLRTAEVD